jgi:hypothetical protein
MKTVAFDIGLKDFTGSCVIKFLNRLDRGEIQAQGQKFVDKKDFDVKEYMKFTDDILNENLISIDITHTPSGVVMKSKEELEVYSEGEMLIAHIVAVISNGIKLGKMNAQP